MSLVCRCNRFEVSALHECDAASLSNWFPTFRDDEGFKVQEIDTTILEEEKNTSGDKCPGTRLYIQEEPKPHVHHYESLVLSVRYNLRSVQLMPGSRPAHTNRIVHTVQ
jgi:hypothetical protein